MNYGKWLFILLLCCPVPAHAWPGTVLSVHDGDTITVARSGNVATPVVVRLYGIDAPELDQPHGTAARDWLKQALPAGQRVNITRMDKDRYGRTIALVKIRGRVLNSKLVSEGYAWVYNQYCKQKFCRTWRKLEKNAKVQHLGLWRDEESVPPWVWRRGGANSK